MFRKIISISVIIAFIGTSICWRDDSWRARQKFLLRAKASSKVETVVKDLSQNLTPPGTFLEHGYPRLMSVPKASSAGIAFDDYITFQDLYRSETKEAIKKEFDLSGIFTDPDKVSRKMSEYRKQKPKPKRIDTIITRQSADTPFQSITELISNSIDATEKLHRPIGRFGVGGAAGSVLYP